MAGEDQGESKREVSFESAIEVVKRLKTDEQLTDLIVTCRGEEWKVHKLWLCAQSEFFKKACTGNFSEAKANKISLDDDDPKMIAALIHYLYNFEYEGYKKGLSDEDLSFDVDMYIIAEKYFVEPLKALAASNFESRATSLWNTNDFFDAVVKSYQQTLARLDNLLRKAVINVLRPHAKELLDVTSDNERFHEMLNQNGELGRDMLIALADDMRDPLENTYRCGSCSNAFSLRVKSDMNAWGCPYCEMYQKISYWEKCLIKRSEQREDA